MIFSFFLIKKAQLFSLSFPVLLHAAQNANFMHTFLVPFLPSQASRAACPSLPALAA